MRVKYRIAPLQLQFGIQLVGTGLRFTGNALSARGLGFAFCGDRVKHALHTAACKSQGRQWTRTATTCAFVAAAPCGGDVSRETRIYSSVGEGALGTRRLLSKQSVWPLRVLGADVSRETHPPHPRRVFRSAFYPACGLRRIWKTFSRQCIQVGSKCGRSPGKQTESNFAS